MDKRANWLKAYSGNSAGKIMEMDWTLSVDKR